MNKFQKYDSSISFENEEQEYIYDFGKKQLKKTGNIRNLQKEMNEQASMSFKEMLEKFGIEGITKNNPEGEYIDISTVNNDINDTWNSIQTNERMKNLNESKQNEVEVIAAPEQNTERQDKEVINE